MPDAWEWDGTAGILNANADTTDILDQIIFCDGGREHPYTGGEREHHGPNHQMPVVPFTCDNQNCLRITNCLLVWDSLT